MKKILKYFLRRRLIKAYGKEVVKNIGINRLIPYFFFQKIIGINKNVPWPVHWSSIVSFPENIKVNYYRPYPGFMPASYIQGMNGIEIGKNVRIGPNVNIVSASHNIYDYDVHDKANPIIIHDNCWLASNCVILPGVELGEHTIVAAGAVVNKSFKEGNCIVGGVPAKKIKSIDNYSEKKS